jgi:hypothetical protein
MSNDATNQGDRTRAAVTGLAVAAALVTPTVACTSKQPAPTEQPTLQQQPDDPDPKPSDDAGAESTDEGEDADGTEGEGEDVAADGPGDWSNQGGTRG